MKEFQKKSLIMLVALFMLGACGSLDESDAGGGNTGGDTGDTGGGDTGDTGGGDTGGDSEDVKPADPTAQSDFLKLVANYSIYDSTETRLGQPGASYGDTANFHANTVPTAVFDEDGNIIIYEWEENGEDSDIKDPTGETSKATFKEFTVQDGARYTAGANTFYLAIDTVTKQLVLTPEGGMSFFPVPANAVYGDDVTDFKDALNEGVLVLTSTAEDVVGLATLKEKFNETVVKELVLSQLLNDTTIGTVLPLGTDATVEITTESEALKEYAQKRVITITQGKNIPSTYKNAFPAGAYTYNRVVKENVMIFKNVNGVELTVSLDAEGSINQDLVPVTDAPPTYTVLTLKAGNGLEVVLYSENS